LACAFYAFGGPRAAAGLACGIGGSAFNLSALWWMIGLGSKANATEKGQRLGAGLIVLGFFAKLPVFIALGFLSQRIGPPAFSCFLVAIGLVYSAVIGWALASS
jgi:hypothetical protein